jgi:5'-3' exonuclease
MGNVVGAKYFKTDKIENLSKYLNNKTVCIDGYMYIYKFCSVYRSDKGELFHGKNDTVTSHIYGLLSFLITLKKLCKNIIFVFEGGSPSIKYAESFERAYKKELAKEAYIVGLKDKTKSEKELINLKKQSFTVTADIISTCKKFLTYLGIDYVIAHSEGERGCADLVKHGFADIVISEDWDVLMFKIPYVIRRIKVRNRQMYGEFLDIPTRLKELNLTHEQLLIMILAAGCDYTPGIPKIGPVNAYNLVKTNSLRTNYPLYYEQILELKALFLKPEEPFTIVKNVLNLEYLRKFLLEECLISYSTVYTHLLILIKDE